MNKSTNACIAFLQPRRNAVAKKLIAFLLGAIIMFSDHGAFAQNTSQPRRISGQVTDIATGEVLVGATIKIQGRDNAATTDGSGKFSIDVAGISSILTVSFTGYTELQVSTEGKTVLDIKLARVTKDLEEVVITGFGLTNRKATLSGAIATVTGEELSHSRATSVSGALVGRVSGINFRQTQGRPGAAPDVRIRNFGGNPLFVIDGVTRNLDAFNNLDFNDIESINVLKDGSAAIYGMLAENGVVVVTTKKGKRGQKPTLSYDTYYGIQQVANFNKPADIKSYIRGIVQTETYGDGKNSYNRTITKEEYDKWMAGTEPGYQGFDWYKYIYVNAPQTQNRLSISGGTDKTDYYISGSTTSQKPMLRNFGQGLVRHNLQANYNATVSKRIKFGIQLNGYYSKLSNANIPGDDYDFAANSAYLNLPTKRPYANDNPLYPQISSSPGTAIYSYGLVGEDVSGVESTIKRNIQANATLEIDILKGLKARILGSYSFLANQFDSRRKSPTLYSYDEATGTYSVSYSTQDRNIDHVFTNTDNTTTNVQLDYKRTFGKHNIQATAGMEHRIAYSPQIRVQGLPPANNIAFLPNVRDFVNNINDDISLYTPRRGYIGSVKYDYKGKYIAEFVGRYDGSFNFKKSAQYGFFPGASLAYRISEENFWQKSSLLRNINDFKIRASYGVLGFETDQNFSFLNGYNYNQGTTVINGAYVLGSQVRGLASDYVTWGRTKTKDIGIDVTLLRNRLTFTIDYFERLRTGILAPRNDVFVPNLVGYTIGQENLNSDKNRGFDGSIAWRDRVGEFSYFIGGNFSYGRSITGFRYNQLFSSDYNRWRNPGNDEGRLNGGSFQLIAIGQFKTWEEIAKHPIDQDGKGNQTLRPGDFIYQDVNNDGFINDLDRKIATYSVNGGTPPLSYGFNFGAGYKGFDIRFDFAGGSLFTFQQNAANISANETMGNYMREWFPNQNTSQYLMDNSSWYSDIWDRNSPIIVGKYPLLLQTTPPPNTSLTSTGWQTNITYVKLRNFELGYTLPYSLMQSIGISKFRIYVSGQNVLIFSNMPGKLDPEISQGGGQSLPNPRILTAGVQVNF
jgi:TonB-linked SusC/RagA family outer membrane protein